MKNNRTAEIFAHENLHSFDGDNAHGFITATEPLTNGAWKPFKGGELIVVKNGKILADLQLA